jgi:hypothetical protein
VGCQLSQPIPLRSRSPLLPGTTGTSFTPVGQSAPLLGVGTAEVDATSRVGGWLKSRMVEAVEEVLGPELGGSRSVEVGSGPSWGETEEWV